MPRAGSQVVLCDLPVRFDTYQGCTHECAYCFVRRKADLSVKLGESADSLRRFINGHRTLETAWCDWDIPIHWGGTSDPFQPAERKHRRSLEALQILVKTKYPFVVSTKATLPGEEPYLSLLGRANVVFQVSMVSPQYDKLEPGAPRYHERLELMRKISPVVPRTIARIQPYALGLCRDVLANLEKLAEAGVYGVTIEGLKRGRRADGFVKVAGDWCYPAAALERDFRRIRQRCHELGLRFYCAENRLRSLGDHPCCCGVDGLGWQTLTANMNHIARDGRVEYSDGMRKPGTAYCFKTMAQDTRSTRTLPKMSYAECMDAIKQTPTYRKVMGLRG